MSKPPRHRIALGALALGVGSLALGLPSRADPPDLVVIVNPANPAAPVTKNDLRPVFQTSRTRWPDGKPSTPFNQPETAEARQRFDQAVLGMSPEEVARYWTDRKIRGGARPPRRLPTPDAVVRAVASYAGGVGYVRRSEADASVKVIAIVRGRDVLAP